MCQGIGDLLYAVLKRFLYHTLDKRVQLGLYRHLHLRVVLIDGQHLNPYVEGYGRLNGLELDALRLLTVADAELELTHRRHLKAHGVLIETKVTDLVLRDAVAHLLQIVQVADIVVDCLLRVRHELHATLEFRFTSE